MSDIIEYSNKIIQKAEERQEFITGDDGFVVYWPNKVFGGAYSSSVLRVIADELDKRNASWEKQIEEYFENN